MPTMASIMPNIFALISFSLNIKKAAILDDTIIPTFRIGYTTAPLLLKLDRVNNKK